MSQPAGFMAALKFPLRGEKRWATLGCCLVCFFIPIVGPLVLIGYGILVEKAVIANPETDAPPFDFGQFSAHLRRGLYPFVVNLIGALVMMLVIVPLFIGLIFLSTLFHNTPWLQLLIMIVAVLFELITVGICTVILVPLTLKAGFEQTIGGAFDWRFTIDFLKRVGFLSIGYNLLLMFFSTIIAPFSLLCFFVGIYVFLAYLMLVQFHIRAQLYLAYIARGGTPLNIQAELTQGFQPVINPPLA